MSRMSATAMSARTMSAAMSAGVSGNVGDLLSVATSMSAAIAARFGASFSRGGGGGVLSLSNSIIRRKTTWKQHNSIFRSSLLRHFPYFLQTYCNQPKQSTQHPWVYDTQSLKFQSFLKNEEENYKKVMSKTKRFQRLLIQELQSRLPSREDPTSVPEDIRDFSYYIRHCDHLNYPLYCRRKKNGKEEIIIDQNKLSQYFDYTFVKAFKVSPDDRYIAFTLDTTGDEIFSVHIQDMKTKSLKTFKEMRNTCSIEWAACPNQPILYYTTCDDKRRPHRVHRCVLGGIRDELVYEEKDDSFFLDVNSTKDNQYITISSNSKTSSEVRLLDATQPNAIPFLFRSRQEGVEYFVEHANDYFYIVTNCDKASNYKVVRQHDTQPKKEWGNFIEASPDTKIEDIDVFHEYCVLYERQNGIPQIRIIPEYDPSKARMISLPVNQKIGVIQPGVNRNFNAKSFLFSLSTPLVPQIIYNYLYESETLQVIREENIPGTPSMCPQDYTIKRIFASSADHCNLPITLIYKKDSIKKNGKNPVLLHAYGAYGANSEAEYLPEKLPLLNRGWIMAIAHVRGGGDLGLKWYHEGKLEKKKNSFTDFIACAEYLIQEKYTHPSLLAGYGVSAGGLIMGVVINERPDLFRAMIMKVPFVDVLSTMLDRSLPLTIHEYDEWGDPRQENVYNYIKSYSPVDNVKKQKYPDLYISGSMKDARVHYWEPVKLVASLRQLNGHHNLILLRMSLTDGHFGASGQFEHMEDAAKEHAFLFHSLQLEQK